MNASEQALRWSVIFHKVTNDFRSNWGATLFAQMRSLVNTAQRQGISAFDAISRALTSQQTDWLLVLCSHKQKHHIRGFEGLPPQGSDCPTLISTPSTPHSII